MTFFGIPTLNSYRCSETNLSNYRFQITGTVLYIILIVYLSKLMLYLLQNWTQIIVLVAFLFVYFSLILDIFFSIIKLSAALSLHNPNPTNYIIYVLYDLSFFIIIVALTVIFIKKIMIAIEFINQGSKFVGKNE